MFDVILALLGLGVFPILGAVADEGNEDDEGGSGDSEGAPADNSASDGARGRDNPPTPEELQRMYENKQLHTPSDFEHELGKRLERERKKQEAEAEKERKRQETEAYKEQEKYKEAYEAEEKSRQSAEEERDKAVQTLNSERIHNSLQSSLRDAGINSERVGPALRIADTSDVTIADDGTVSGVDKVVEAVKKDSPEWFEAERKPANGSPPSPRPANNARSEDDDEKARERARRQTRSAF